MIVFGIDVGSGDVKLTLWNDGALDFYKQINAVAKLPSNAVIPPEQSEDLVELNGNKYLVGPSAVMIKASSQFETASYEAIKKLSPIVIKKYLDKYKSIDKIVIDISIAYLSQSADLTSHIVTTLGIDPNKLSIVPQGIGCKMAYDKFGDSPYSTETTPVKSYYGVDIGFNTIDCFQVVKGSLTSDGVSAKEQAGIIRIAEKVVDYCKSQGLAVSLAKAKELILTKNGSFRSQPIKGLPEAINKFCQEYCDTLLATVENENKEILDVSDSLILFGGGAELLRPFIVKSPLYNPEFIRVPEKAEFYNSLGLIVYALRKAEANK